MTGRMLQMSGAVADLLYHVEAMPAAGEEAVVDGFSISPGGGFNAMVAAKRAGMAVCYGGGIGSGAFADIVIEGLDAEGIPVLQPRDPDRDQGCCCVLTDRNGERTFVSSDGAEGHVSEEAIARIDFGGYDWILLSGYSLSYAGSREALGSWLRREGDIPNLVFDPSPIVARIRQDLLRAALERATWISANAREAAVLTGRADPAGAARELAAGRPEGGGAVVRMGADGCVIATAQGLLEVPPYRVDVVDTNGAGDAHLGSFVARLDQAGDPAGAAAYANVAAAMSTRERGPATAPDKELVMQAMLGSEAS